MKNVLIAIDELDLFKNIKLLFEKNNFNVYEKNLMYEDAIFDVVENKFNFEKIDLIIIKSSIIENHKRFKKLINNHIKIIVFINENELVENYKNVGFIDVYKESDLNIAFIKLHILKKNNPQGKNIDKVDNFSQNLSLIKKEIKSFPIFENDLSAEIIVFTGESKCGKTSLAINTLNMIKEKKKILFIDFSYRNKDIFYLYDIKNHNENFCEKVINDNNVTYLLNIFSLINKNLNNKKRNSVSAYLKKLLLEYRKQYDLIIIDLDKNNDYQVLKCIFLLATKIFFIIEPISLELYNSINLIEFFKNKKILNEEKINIIFNKYDYNSISIEILKEVFKKYKIECIVKRKMKYRRILNKDIKYGYRIRE